jgi:hypothetical protein
MQPRRSYEAPQIELLRTKLRAYFWAEKAIFGDDFAWPDLNVRVALYTGVTVQGDTLRQFAERQLDRGKPRSVGTDILDAIVSFLTHTSIKALNIEELKAPAIPYHFALQLMDALKYSERRRPTVPPSGLAGSYRALVHANGKISDIRLTILRSLDGNLVHLTEEADIYRDTPFKDFREWSVHERKLYHDKFTKSRGWGLLTPEDNLLGFLKRRVRTEAEYRDNHFYATMGVIPDFSEATPIEKEGTKIERPIKHLALLAYDVPYGKEDEIEDKGEWFEKKCQNTVSKLRHFVRIAEEG